MSVAKFNDCVRIMLATAAMFLFCGVPNSAYAQNQNQQNTGGGGQTNTGGGGNQTQPQLGTVGQEGSGVEVAPLGQLSEQMGTGFIGQGAPDSFVGANQAAQNAGPAQTRNFQQANQGQNPNQFNQNLPTTTGTGVGAIRYRPPFKLAFNMPRPSSRNVDLNLTRKISNLTSKKPMFAGVAFVVSEQNTVTLTGTVKSEADRQLAQLYIKMEPGVDKVIDQLTVESETIQGTLLELPDK